ncbi:ketol-acid reductoisomerase [Neoactinobaculum massilliense]|uniref:ketol-acid reductoisomerase n=1 Tax=Neoactinobaculum massilliense TaxID=2364794 RepID=UPI000F532D8A|nr:ketol-acid reductoisomerase [Neoactinobaculum massilliense]
MEELYFDDDVDLAPIQGRVAVMGTGVLARAHALNLRDSGVDVVIGAGGDTAAIAELQDYGFPVVEPAEAASGADAVAILTPVQEQGEVWVQVEPALGRDVAIVLGAGFAIHFGFIRPSRTHDVVLVASQGAAEDVRGEFERGRGVPAMVAVQQDGSGAAWEVALAYAKAVGGTRGGAVPTTFAEQTEASLFASQAVTGGVARLLEDAYGALEARGFTPEIAELAVSRALAGAAHAFAEGGVAGIHGARSTVDEFGDYTAAAAIAEGQQDRMAAALDAVHTGAFAQAFVNDVAAGAPRLREERERRADAPIDRAAADVAQLYARRRA